MAVVKKLAVYNFRSHNELDIDLSPTVNVITGDNGTGKTSLIEAIYLALQGSSFKGSDKDLLTHDAPWWRIDISFDNYKNRSITFNPNLESGRKKFEIDDRVNKRLVPKNKYPVVLFEPEDLRLMHGSPSRRRQFIDRFISQLDPFYASALSKYDRALKQRNNLLKNKLHDDEQIFAWDVIISEYGAYIIEKRIGFLEQINSQIDLLYSSIAEKSDNISIHYSHTYIGDIKQKILNDLSKNIERDKILGYTSIGPHRHDVIFKFNSSPALDVASRGEVRTIMLAIKYIEVEIIEKITGLKPIILLDDVFSELDDKRQHRLLLSDHQVIITSTKLPNNLSVKINNIKLS